MKKGEFFHFNSFEYPDVTNYRKFTQLSKFCFIDLVLN